MRNSSGVANNLEIQIFGGSAVNRNFASSFFVSVMNAILLARGMSWTTATPCSAARRHKDRFLAVGSEGCRNPSSMANRRQASLFPC